MGSSDEIETGRGIGLVSTLTHLRTGSTFEEGEDEMEEESYVHARVHSVYVFVDRVR